MKKYYSDLDLKSLAIECGLDFAHYTYEPGMCSCCFGPLRFSDCYWVNGSKGRKRAENIGNYTYILFKNAENGSGVVSDSDLIENDTYIGYRVNNKNQLLKVCEHLQKQLGNDYEIVIPDDFSYCIEIKYLG